jgi:hypothetical protein
MSQGGTPNWFAYIHDNGKVVFKRYHNPVQLEDAYESPFVVSVISPFEVKDDSDRQEVFQQIVKDHYGIL